MEILEERYRKFGAGTELQLQDILGCHQIDRNFRFSVWAPKARQVWLVGDFNDWQKTLPMSENEQGIWTVITDQPRLANFINFWLSKLMVQKS